MRRLVQIVLLFALGAAAVAAHMLGQPVGAVAQTSQIEASKRISLAPPPVAAPAPVPASAAKLPYLTFVVETTRVDRDGSHRTTQTISRSADRTRLELPGGRQEWLFVQNGVYRDRVSAYLIDHEAREVRFHDEGLLRSRLGIRGWMDVLTIRFDSAVLDSLHRTGEQREAAGASVSRFVAPEARADGLVEVWWSEELLLPLSVTRRASGVELTSVVDQLTHGLESTVLADPADRFRTYKRVDAADAGDH